MPFFAPSVADDAEGIAFTARAVGALIEHEPR